MPPGLARFWLGELGGKSSRGTASTLGGRAPSLLFCKYGGLLMPPIIEGGLRQLKGGALNKIRGNAPLGKYRPPKIKGGLAIN